MKRHEWTSPATGESMRVVRFGDRGTPLIYVPSSGGDQDEFAAYGMADACAPWIDDGHVQVFSIDGFAPASLWDDGLAPPRRIQRYAAFERCVARELLPWVVSLAGGEIPAVVGASYGGFVAANLLFKYPGAVNLACGLGGVYGLWHRLDGYHDDEVYYHTPLEYLPRLEDPAILGAIRRTRGMVLFGAEDDEWLDSTLRMRQVLVDRRLPHQAEVWPSPANHHERWWRRQLVVLLERFF